MFRTMTLIISLAFSLPLYAGNIIAEEQHFYYGSQVEQYSTQEVLNEAPMLAASLGQSIIASQRNNFKKELHIVLDSYHISRDGDFDEIVDFCHIDENDRCYSQIKLSYKTARMYLFGDLHLVGNNQSSYKIEAHYCQEWISNDEFPSQSGLGPMLIPAAQIMNTEHTWPQSHFSNKFPASLQKSDLHALYPTISSVNSTRGNEAFGEVEEVISTPCPESALGKNKYNERVFEPAEEVKGNVARAKFYFSTRYDIAIPPHEEEVLRRWHELDPVDDEEIKRANHIFEIQHVRNPFIDHPEWVQRIDNF